MGVEVVTKPIPHISADFETTTSPDDCRVWCWGAEDVHTGKFTYGINIGSFMRFISEERSITHFHNLKFDAGFMMDWLLKNGYTHTVERKLGKGTFTTLISDMGKMYSMSVRFKNGTTVEFRDTLKKFPMSVARVAKTFNLPEGKGVIDYDKPRPVGYMPTPEEIEYQRLDVHIIAQAVKQSLDAGMTKLTIGSDAMSEYQRIVGNRDYEMLFPVFGEHLDSEIRRAYRGGFAYADERFKSRRLGRGGVVLDVNSLYPFIMYTRDMPYGEPLFFEGRPKPVDGRPLTIFSVTFTARLKPGHIPCIQIKGSHSFTPTDYLSVIDEPTQLMVTNVDWQLYLDHYDITVLEWGGGWAFTAQVGMFQDYIDKWSRVKETSTGGAREIAKLHLNNLYGKYASNPNVTSKYPILKDDRVQLKRGPDETRAPVYTPVGVFITSWARDYTIRAAQANYEHFAYADTDSLHLLTPDVPTDLHVHPTELGAWKLEYHFDDAFYIRAKAYLERLPDGSYVNRIAGLPTRLSERLTFDDVFDGNVIHGKLTPRSVPGGIVLMPAPFKLKL